MSTEARFIDLLTWVKARGLHPRRPKPGDRFLCPITKRIAPYRDLRPHQVRNALWIPTVDGLQDKGIKVDREDLGVFKVVKSARLFGAGLGEEEAVLSLLNQVRAAQAA